MKSEYVLKLVSSLIKDYNRIVFAKQRELILTLN